MDVDRRQLAAIFCGGFLGAVARAALAEWLGHPAGGWPWATLLANVAGALLLGWISVRLGRRSPYARSLLGAGFCGALTTFSTLELELLGLLDGGHAALAGAYAATSVVLGLLAVAAGTSLGRRGERRA